MILVNWHSLFDIFSLSPYNQYILLWIISYISLSDPNLQQNWAFLWITLPNLCLYKAVVGSDFFPQWLGLAKIFARLWRKLPSWCGKLLHGDSHHVEHFKIASMFASAVIMLILQRWKFAITFKRSYLNRHHLIGNDCCPIFFSLAVICSTRNECFAKCNFCLPIFVRDELSIIWVFVDALFPLPASLSCLKGCCSIDFCWKLPAHRLDHIKCHNGGFYIFGGNLTVSKMQKH